MNLLGSLMFHYWVRDARPLLCLWNEVVSLSVGRHSQYVTVVGRDAFVLVFCERRSDLFVSFRVMDGGPIRTEDGTSIVAPKTRPDIGRTSHQTDENGQSPLLKYPIIILFRNQTMPFNRVVFGISEQI
jgi:hypothetical protein